MEGAARERIGSWELLKVWLALGAQSFGGGAATLTLVRQAVIERHQWAPAEEVDRDWAISQVAPGINLVAFTILLGQRIAGIRGSLIALFGLMFPSVVLTALLTAVYAGVKTNPLVLHAVRGIVPTTVGIGLYTSYDMAKGLYRLAKPDGAPDVAMIAAVLLASPLVVALATPVPAVLIGCGAFGGVFRTLRARGQES